MLFPSTRVAMRCLKFLMTSQPDLSEGNGVRLIDLVLEKPSHSANSANSRATMISAVLFLKSSTPIASKFWQHSGDGISSRRAEFFHRAFNEGHLVPRQREHLTLSGTKSTLKGPRRYQKVTRDGHSTPSAEAPENGSLAAEHAEYVQFVEERFGRNLNLSLATNAKLAIRRRIAGSLMANVDLKDALAMADDVAPVFRRRNLSEDDVYLYPTGMSSIFNIHRVMLKARGAMKSIMFGYVRDSFQRTCNDA